MKTSLVIGESGADWAAGISRARRMGPNLSLITQWTGELPEHFCRRVVSRLSRRCPPLGIVVVCNDRNELGATEARRSIVRAAAEAMSEMDARQLTILCAPSSSGGIPVWAPALADHLPRGVRPLGLNVELCTAAA